MSYSGDTSFRQVNGARKTATDNSLFAKGSGGDTAYIEYMRHLQNLNASVSGVSADKTAAVQIADITCTEGYNFRPIENTALNSYNGRDYEIRELRIKDTSGASGLFGHISGKTLSNITLVNASVSGNGYTGALVGIADGVNLEHCRVYWESDSAAGTNLRELLGDSERGIQHKITSNSVVGGLAGSMQNSTIRNSFAATTLSGTTAGGLVGYSDGNLSIESSYGDNYLKGTKVGGLIGHAAGTAAITDSQHYNFTQELNLDYSVYKGYDLFTSDNTMQIFTRQSPIGVSAVKPFRGNYYGNCHTIKNVTVTAQSNYAGLFGYSTGTIEDVAYLITENAMGKLSIEGHSGSIYVGGLVGYNGGIIRNCAVAGMSINIYAYSYSTVYSGGLVGWNQGAVSDSSAALTGVTVDTTLSNAHVGGFVGANSGTGSITQCYAVGRISVSRAQYGSVYACGFGGGNQGTISKCYAAADLQVSGGAIAYGFCKDFSKDCVYLNGGNFEYEEINFTAQYQDDSASGETWSKLTADGDAAAEVLGMHHTAMSYDNRHDGDAANDGQYYPFPSSVKDSNGNHIHYGRWPTLMDLGAVGVYYWEKMDTFHGETVINTSYHFSVIKTDLDELTMDKVDTLTTAHNDGGVITEFGYGYFYERKIADSGTEASLTSSGIGLSNGDFMTDPAVENCAANEALSALMEGNYDFHSYNTWGTERYSAADKTNTGLYITGNTTSGKWALEIKNDKIETRLVFEINPFFADTLSFEGVSGNSQLDLTYMHIGKRVPMTATGTTSKYPYQVRSIDQLQFINWNYAQKDTNTVLTSTNCTQFPYLSYYSKTIVTRGLHWKQTHDINGQGETYTPIAEFYDSSLGNTGSLSGWFGDAYNGDDYVIQDVNIQGQTSSCAGLFGIVYNGSLKSIVIYSSDGTATVTSSKDPTCKSCWYAIGVLAGLAAADSGNTAIENCSVAGYTVVDQHYTSSGGWGGSGVGGLLGISNMQLSGCAAVTTIKITATDNDNMRIGGLVGTCQQSISSCYSGGAIEFAGVVPRGKGVYIGGIVGGIYMKQLKAGRLWAHKQCVDGLLYLCNAASSKKQQLY